ncbi:ketosynthase chain-length factor [Streptomyces griseochromogenes]|uniref:Beta-ketoacyl synthase n=2 Tax=Streptomyces griseochromogenes TaxID=68214 RepID=A0A1B1BB22_9ACTN|nr:ketosynthase chain-length factor [Streptomyces griseochromogenes]ANP55997.1 beta-ketoacyl synthase [Streptomyces griseochromogenes]
MTAVITGIGVCAPNGLGTEEFWKRTLDGTNAIGPIARFDASSYPVRLAGEISGFDPAAHLPGRLLPQTDRMTQFALTATDWAMEDAGAGAGTEGFDPFDRGVVTASSAGGFEFGQRELEALWSRGPEHVSVYQSFAWFYAVNTGQISIRRNMRGPTGVIVTEQAGGLDVLGQARRHVRRGTGMVVSGGMESPLSPWAVAAQIPSGRLSRRTDPDRAYQPFDERASGHVIGEGGAILIVEDADKARERGAAQVYGEIAGYCATFDPPQATGRGPRLEAAVSGALADAGIRADEVDVVFADAAGVPDLDRAEATALAAVFGPRGVPVTAPKTMTGRLSSGGAPLDVAAALLSIRDGIIPPTVNVTREAFRHELDLVREPRQGAVSTALIVARGYGGFNAALVVRSVA